ncbi:MAG TPA: substrate-binding domain-containing protein [Acidimicrobiales bacterium]|nr:substrate-binding domain-containing protein [Acidimicrobiales bacterium]
MAFEFKAPGQLASEAVLAGANQVAAAYGFCSPSYRAPPTAVDAMEQVAAIKADVKAGDKVVLLSADDPFLPGPALRAAMKAGVKVVTFGSGADVPGARDFFVQDVAYNTLAQVVVNAVVEAEGPQAELGVMTMTPDALPQVSWLGAVQSYAETHHLTVKTVEWLPFASPLTSVEDMVRTYPGLRAVLALDEAAIAGAAQAVTDLHRAGKLAVFGIGDPAPLRRFFANGSLRALFGWDEVAEGELLICLAKLAYEGEVHPGGAFSCHHGPEGSWAVTAKDNPGTGATRGTVIFSQPLEFTPENYKSYGF